MVLQLAEKMGPKMIELSFFGDDAEFHHIGLAVKSIRMTLPQAKTTEDDVQKVSVAFASINGMTIELIEPSGDETPVTQALDRGQKLLHVCFVVPSLKKAVNTCRKYGFYPISKPASATAFNKRKIVWVYSVEYGLFELLGNG